MKILLINYEYPPIGAGAANATYYMAKSFLSLGHEVVIITSAFQNLIGKSNEDGITVYRIPANRKFKDHSNIIQMLSYILSGLVRISSIIRENKIDYSIAFFTIPGAPISYLLYRLYKIPYIVSLRGGDVPGAEKKIENIHKILTPIRRLFLRNAKSIIANSRGLAELSQKSDSFPVSVIPNGVDCNFFQKSDSKARNRNYVFLFVGRFQEQKNLFQLLEQFAKAKEKNQNIELRLVGDGPLKNRLEMKAIELEIESGITWYGWKNKEELKTIYQNADCFINPSLYEGMPNTVMEAMASCLPVIASDIFGNNDLITHGKTGFLYSLNKPDELNAHMLSLSSNIELSQKYGLNGRLRVEADFSWDSVAKKYLEVMKWI